MLYALRSAAEHPLHLDGNVMRENLSKVAADLSVPAEGISHNFPDPGLRESLREAREAIILAEALLEVKRELNMPNPRTEHRVICSFTSKEWTGRPADGAGAMFGRFSVVGFVVCLTLMLFVPWLRDVGARVLFVAIFATTFTTLSILAKSSSERAVLQRLTATVNEVILELTADKGKTTFG